MKRDMDLVRLILLKIEEEHTSGLVMGITIDNYDIETVAYHCEIMYQAGLILEYKRERAWGNKTVSVAVGGLTWEGQDYLDKVRDDKLWKKTKEEISKKGLPLVFDTIKTISNAFVTAAAEGLVNSIIKNGGV